MALNLRRFEPRDLHDLNRLLTDPQVTHDLGGPFTPVDVEERLHCYLKAQDTHGYARMAAFLGPDFAGYVGIMHQDGKDHPLGPHDEIGWRILPAFWGKGIATKAAHIALQDVFDRVGLPHVLAYTTATNLPSQAVMTRLGMTRRPDMDFEEVYPPIGTWQGLTWRITASDYRAGGME
ncbi:MAG: GNAT family N-acetyltransferase [Pseudomonadota bacterium]